MTETMAWDLIQVLEDAGLARITEYTCEGTPEQCRDNPSGTMILLHPGLRLADLPERMAGGDELISGVTRDGMMASAAAPPTEVFCGGLRNARHLFSTDEAANAATWQYWFVPMPDEADDA